MLQYLCKLNYYYCTIIIIYIVDKKMLLNISKYTIDQIGNSGYDNSITAQQENWEHTILLTILDPSIGERRCQHFTKDRFKLFEMLHLKLVVDQQLQHSGPEREEYIYHQVDIVKFTTWIAAASNHSNYSFILHGHNCHILETQQTINL